MADQPSEKPQSATEAPRDESQSTPELTPQVQALLDKVRQETEAKVESFWRPQVDELRTEMGKKETTHGGKLKDMQARLDAAEAAVEVAALGDDAQALASSKVQVQRIQRAFEEEREKLSSQAVGLRVREIALDIFAAYPGLPKQFKDEASRRLGQGVPSYVIEREAAAVTKVSIKPENATGPAREPTAPALPVGHGSNSSNLASYKQALRDGAKLPSAAEIDAATAEFLSAQRG